MDFIGKKSFFINVYSTEIKAVRGGKIFATLLLLALS